MSGTAATGAGSDGQDRRRDGRGSGIGRATALLSPPTERRSTWRISTCSPAEATAAAITAAGRRGGSPSALDVTDAAAVESFAEAVLTADGPVDVLHNDAGKTWQEHRGDHVRGLGPRDRHEHARGGVWHAGLRPADAAPGRRVHRSSTPPRWPAWCRPRRCRPAAPRSQRIIGLEQGPRRGFSPRDDSQSSAILPGIIDAIIAASRIIHGDLEALSSGQAMDFLHEKRHVPGGEITETVLSDRLAAEAPSSPSRAERIRPAPPPCRHLLPARSSSSSRAESRAPSSAAAGAHGPGHGRPGRGCSPAPEVIGSNFADDLLVQGTGACRPGPGRRQRAERSRWPSKQGRARGLLKDCWTHPLGAGIAAASSIKRVRRVRRGSRLPLTKNVADRPPRASSSTSRCSNIDELVDINLRVPLRDPDHHRARRPQGSRHVVDVAFARGDQHPRREPPSTNRPSSPLQGAHAPRAPSSCARAAST